MMNPLVMDQSTVDITNKMVDNHYRLLEAQEAIQEFANNLKCNKWEGKLPFISSPITAYFEGEMEFHQNENPFSILSSTIQRVEDIFQPMCLSLFFDRCKQ